jgi:catabolite regulation protein CreA
MSKSIIYCIRTDDHMLNTNKWNNILEIMTILKMSIIFESLKIDQLYFKVSITSYYQIYQLRIKTCSINQAIKFLIPLFFISVHKYSFVKFVGVVEHSYTAVQFSF